MYNVKGTYKQRFDSSCKDWEANNMKYNLMRMTILEQYCNDVLRSRGYVFLRDIYEYLGIPITRESLFAGWYYDPSEVFEGNHIDFHIHISEDEQAVELEFNADKDITKHF